MLFFKSPHPGFSEIFNPRELKARQWTYDVLNGYTNLHSQSIASAYKSEDHDIYIDLRLNELQKVGFQEVEVFDADYLSYWHADINPDGRNLMGKDFTSEQLHDVFTKILNDDVQAALHRFFLSEFAVIFFYAFSTADAVGDPSFRWHMDAGPSSHLKMLIYMNDDHDGHTDFIDCAASAQLQKAGYNCHSIEARLPDLCDFAADYGVDFTSVVKRPKAGNGLIFSPTEVLHKGVAPSYGTRQVIQLGIVPNLDPWTVFFEKHHELLEKNINGFPQYKHWIW